MKKIIILGASGAGTDIYYLINDINKFEQNKYEILGFLDDNIDKVDKKFEKYLIGNFKDNKKYNDVEYAIAIGNEKNFLYKSEIIKKLDINLNKFPNLIHPSVTMNKDIKIGYGNIIHAKTVISSNVNIGNFNLLLYNTTVNHDVNLGSFLIINSSVTIAGNVNVGDSCYIGQGTNIRDKISIGKNCLVGMGSLVLKDLEPNTKYINKNVK